MITRIRCQVLETADHDDWLARRSRGHRELLPWADPYIAGLMRRLEDRYSPADDVDLCDPFAPDDEPASSALSDPPLTEWHEDAFMPPTNSGFESPRVHSYPPVFGGFPLLDEAIDTEADSNLNSEI